MKKKSVQKSIYIYVYRYTCQWVKRNSSDFFFFFFQLYFLLIKHHFNAGTDLTPHFVHSAHTSRHRHGLVYIHIVCIHTNLVLYLLLLFQSWLFFTAKITLQRAWPYTTVCVRNGTKKKNVLRGTPNEKRINSGSLWEKERN